NIIYLLQKVGVNYKKYIRDLWISGIFQVKLLNNSFFLSANKIDKGMLEIFYQGSDISWDAYSIVIWSKLAIRSRTTLDIGANFGLYAIAAKAANPNCSVYAFEPSIYGLQMLEANVKANNFVIETQEIALSNENGYVPFL